MANNKSCAVDEPMELVILFSSTPRLPILTLLFP